MDPVTMGLVAMGVGGGLKAFAGLFDDTASRKAALMRKEADLSESALEESMRRVEGSQTQVMSSTKARMAGSGFATDSGSFEQFLTGMASEFQKQDTFAKAQGMASIDLQREAADITDSTGLFKALNFGADVLGLGGQIAAVGKWG